MYKDKEYIFWHIFFVQSIAPNLVKKKHYFVKRFMNHMFLQIQHMILINTIIWNLKLLGLYHNK
jgi:hypothetical protein